MWEHLNIDADPHDHEEEAFKYYLNYLLPEVFSPHHHNTPLYIKGFGGTRANGQSIVQHENEFDFGAIGLRLCAAVFAVLNECQAKISVGIDAEPADMTDVVTGHNDEPTIGCYGRAVVAP